METFIRGACETMCPKPELEMRTREKLLHFYELKAGSRTEPDPARVVKEFARSAAGVRHPKRNELRTIRSLNRTVEYLLTDIFQDERRPYSFKYDFIFDRLRAVRQETVIQNLAPHDRLQILEPTVCFLAYSAYRLCESHITEFDPKICSTHLQECVKNMLRCYDELDEQSQRSYSLRRRVQLEALYLLFNLGSSEAIARGISLRKDLRDELKLPLAMSIEYCRSNFHNVLRHMEKLPPLEAAVASLKVPEIRRQLLLRFSVAFHSKVLTVPLDWIGHVLRYQERETTTALLDDCRYYSLALVEQSANQSAVPTEKVTENWWDESGPDSGTAVKFEKTRFDSSKPPSQPRRLDFVDRKLGEEPSIVGRLLLARC